MIETTARNSDEIGVSTITLVETIYLIEKQKVPADTLPRMAAALRTPKGVFVEVPLDLDIAETLARVDRSLVPDMPDRIVAAAALHLKVPVISRDGKITVSGVTTIW